MRIGRFICKASYGTILRDNFIVYKTIDNKVIYRGKKEVIQPDAQVLQIIKPIFAIEPYGDGKYDYFEFQGNINIINNSELDTKLVDKHLKTLIGWLNIGRKTP